MSDKFLDKLKSLTFIKLLLISISVSVVLSAFITASMSLTINGRIVAGYMLTSLVASIVVAAIIVCVVLAVTEKVKAAEAELMATNEQLSSALLEIKQLKGILPICSFCKNIRSEKGDWQQIEEYISSQTNAEFSHGVCPACREENYSDFSK